MRAVDALNTYFPAALDDSPSALSTSTNGSHAKSASNGHSLSSSPTTVSNLGRRVSSGWSNSLGSGGSLWNSPSASSASSPAYPSNGAGPAGAIGTNGHSNGSGRTSLGNGSSNGNGGASYDYALPVMHLSLRPAHVKLNLSIQAFIESFRQLAPSSSPSTPSSSVGDLSGSMSMSMSTSIHVPSGAGKGPQGGSGLSSSAVTLTNALTAAQGLHAEAKKLDPEDRAVYLQEIKDVGALLAYTDPETSILKGFLEQTRRIALADQVNRAILCELSFLLFALSSNCHHLCGETRYS